MSDILAVNLLNWPVKLSPGELLLAWMISTIILMGVGLFALVMNFWAAARPARVVHVFAWVCIIASPTLAFLFVDYRAGLLLGAAAVVVGGLVQWRGMCTNRSQQEQDAATTQEAEAGRSGKQEALAQLVGQEGTAVSDIKPHGTIAIEGRVMEVKAARGFIPTDARVVVARIEGGMPIVESASSEQAAS